MAITKIVAIRDRLDKRINYAVSGEKTTLDAGITYATNPEKTEQHFFTSALNCESCETAYAEMQATTAYATGGDPLTIVNNLSDFIFSVIKAIGIIILGWGIVQVGMSIQSHDASQRTQGLLCLFGGLLIAFAKEILTLIGAV